MTDASASEYEGPGVEQGESGARVGPRHRRVAFWAVAVGLVALSGLFPGDVSFHNDEPRLIGLALGANAEAIAPSGAFTTAIAFYATAGLSRHNPQYIALWLPAFFFYWRPLSQGWRYARTRLVFYVHATALLLLLILFVASVHRTGGDRRAYGPTLENQIAVARELVERNAERPIPIRASGYRRWPHRLAVLLRLQGADPEAGGTAALAIDYRDGMRASSGGLDVVSRYRPIPGWRYECLSRCPAPAEDGAKRGEVRSCADECLRGMNLR